MRRTPRALASLASALAAVAAHALTLDTSNAHEVLSLDDGKGSTATATIEHVSSDSPDFASAVDRIETREGKTVTLASDLSGVFHVNDFAVDYSPKSPNGSTAFVLGWDFAVTIPDFYDYTSLSYGETDASDGEVLYYNNTTSQTAPFRAYPTYVDYDGDGMDDSLSIQEGYGYGLDGPVSYVDTRFVLLGYQDPSDPDHAIIADGVELTLRATIAAPVPEPGTFAALGLGALALARRRRG